ncbi:sugar phosphorylase [Paraferrimonas sp. SM1919]|uniref:sugar phosphorylase n=1 Tax=Paraferrimonas sp. SM1919 TaxID=2662263 RepID=UPI001969A8B4|nr:sugar phosphorylase [Paraferrimonas sp. SM1919]
MSQHNLLSTQLQALLAPVYSLSETEFTDLCEQLLAIMGLNKNAVKNELEQHLWDENDVFLITYGDSINHPHKPSLQCLEQFMHKYVDHFTGVHILPFYPYSSDDGFAVIDYTSVNESLGNWNHISRFAQAYRLMADLVINHGSSRSIWFEQFCNGVEPGSYMFYQGNPADDLSKVVRPRTSPLLRKVDTLNGEKHLWCTFSHDQIDFNFEDPRVFVQFIKIIAFYLEKGIRIFRLDAVAFLWKEVGTDCLNLPQTHQLIKVIRLLIEQVAPNAIIISETNLPNEQNLSYFGNSNEAHSIYNFSLPPLLLHTLTTGNSQALTRWLMALPPCVAGNCYLNFIASHDGIGLRPVEGLLSAQQIQNLVQHALDCNGQVSFRKVDQQQQKPYELNIALFDAMSRMQSQSKDSLQISRFIAAHVVMLSIEGIPAFYLHSLLATQNDINRFENSGHKRHINRRRYLVDEIESALGDKNNHQHKVFTELNQIIKIRQQQKAFHPNATQFTLQLGSKFIGLWRQSLDKKQSIFCVINISCETALFSLAELNLIDGQNWYDLLGHDIGQDPFSELRVEPYQCLWITNI